MDETGNGKGETGKVIPARYQPPLPLDKLLLPVAAPGAGDRMELDVLIVGAGPAGLACAIELARVAQREHTDVNIGVLEKAEALGEHCLSGAVVNPRAFRELFPDLRDADFPFRGPVTKERVAFLTSRRAFTLPTPPTMHNAGNYVASLCEIVRWLGERATRSEEHTSELQSLAYLVCRLLLEKKKNKDKQICVVSEHLRDPS